MKILAAFPLILGIDLAGPTSAWLQLCGLHVAFGACLSQTSPVNINERPMLKRGPARDPPVPHELPHELPHEGSRRTPCWVSFQSGNPTTIFRDRHKFFHKISGFVFWQTPRRGTPRRFPPNLLFRRAGAPPTPASRPVSAQLVTLSQY